MRLRGTRSPARRRTDDPASAIGHARGGLTVLTTAVVGPDALEALVDALRTAGFRVLGPTVRDGAIVYDDLESAAELPVGWTETQDAGTYRLERRQDQARFGYAVGPHSWKQFLFPARVKLWHARGARTAASRSKRRSTTIRRWRCIGVRSCELHAIDIQDRVFLGGRYTDGDYAARRA